MIRKTHSSLSQFEKGFRLQDAGRFIGRGTNRSLTIFVCGDERAKSGAFDILKGSRQREQRGDLGVSNWL